MRNATLLAGTIAIGLATAAVYAAEGQTAAAEETPEQRCQRWADLEQVPAKDRNQYIKDCVRDLKIPDPKPEGGGE